MKEKIQAIRGMHDALPDTTPAWRYLETTITRLLGQYGYQEIRLPILEKTGLFERSIGEQTDIVAKEMYTFEDRNGERLTLRPEGTAGCVRACLENGLLQNNALRLWYLGPMFRHERPQKGRLRQFHQIGVEAFGMNGPDIDAEQIILCARLWKALQLPGIRLELNSLGSPEARGQYRQVLVDYFQAHRADLDEDSRTRLDKNPLRILDSKNPAIQPLITAAPAMMDYLDEESAAHFARLQELLTAAGLEFSINPRLVRGLDYYGRTVFEWVTDRLGAQGTVCAGGRYDGLVGHFGGKPTPAVGFAMGLERLLGLLEIEAGRTFEQKPHAYFIIPGDDALPDAIRLSEQLRDSLPGLRLLLHSGGGSYKSQFRKADKSGAQLALILGEEEQQRQAISVKPLRTGEAQFETTWRELAGHLAGRLDLHDNGCVQV